MLNSRILTPFKAGQKHELSNTALDLPQPQAPFTTRHPSTASGASLGNRIQKHLDAGKPLYIGFDPADPPRDSRDISRTCGDGGERGGGGMFHKRRNKHEKWLRVLTFGAPLDIAVKFILTMGMTMALLALLWATNRLIQNRRLDKDFNIVLVIAQCIWGVFFGASCIFGMELMWGKWRRSPSAALFFTISWVLVSLVLLVISAVWIYFYLTFRAIRIEKCLEKTVKVTITWDKDSLRRMAPQAQIDNCLGRVGSKVNWTLAWGIIYALFSYSGLIVVVWGRDYRRRLLEISEYEEAKKFPSHCENDKVGLLLGTAPLGRLPSPRAIVSPEDSPENQSDGEDTKSFRVTTMSQATEPIEQRNTRSIIRISGSAQPYRVQVDTKLPQGERVGSMVSSISSAGSTGSGIVIDGQRFMLKTDNTI